MSRIDFDLTRIRGVVFDVDGVLSPSTIPLGADGMPRRMVNIKDGYAMQLAVKKGLRLAIISGGRDESVRERYLSLGITDVYLGAARKLPVYERWLSERGLEAGSVAYVGDDIPDYEPMQRAALAVAPADAAPEIRSCAGYVSPVSGGYGVARDLLEQILKAQGLWMACDKAFGW